MGFTYVSRQGHEDIFKAGKATTLTTRQNSLRTGNTELALYDYVETEYALEGERFLKALWVTRKHRHRKEFYRLTETEVRAGLDELRHYLAEVLPVELAQKAELAELELADNSEMMIEPTDEITAAHRRLVAIEADLRRLNAEADPLRRMIMLAVGKERGITGIATFDKADSNRWMNTTRLQVEHPALWEQFQKTVFDNAAFKKKRTFVLNEDLDID